MVEGSNPFVGGFLLNISNINYHYKRKPLNMNIKVMNENRINQKKASHILIPKKNFPFIESPFP